MRKQIIDALKRTKDKVVDVTSDVLSAPSRAISGVKKKVSDDFYEFYKNKNNTYKRTREEDEAGKPDAGNESDPLFRYRINALNREFDEEQARQNAKPKQKKSIEKLVK